MKVFKTMFSSDTRKVYKTGVRFQLARILKKYIRQAYVSNWLGYSKSHYCFTKVSVGFGQSDV